MGGVCCNEDTINKTDGQANSFKVCMLNIEHMKLDKLSVSNARPDMEIDQLDTTLVKMNNVTAKVDGKPCILNVWERNVTSVIGTNSRGFFQFYYQDVDFIVILAKTSDMRALEKIKSITREITQANNYYSKIDQVPVYIIGSTDIRKTSIISDDELNEIASDNDWTLAWALDEQQVEECLKQFAQDVFEQGINPENKDLNPNRENNLTEDVKNKNRDHIASKDYNQKQRRSFFEDDEDDLQLDSMMKQNNDMMALYHQSPTQT